MYPEQLSKGERRRRTPAGRSGSSILLDVDQSVSCLDRHRSHLQRNEPLGGSSLIPFGAAVSVPVMRVRKMRMPVLHRLVAVRVTMLDTWRHRLGVHVLVVFIVRVFGAMLERFVNVFMLVVLGQMQPHTERH